MTYIIGEACIDVKDISCQSVCPDKDTINRMVDEVKPPAEGDAE